MEFLKRTLRATRFLGRHQWRVCCGTCCRHRARCAFLRLIAAGISTLALCFTGTAVARTDDPAAAILTTSEQGLTGCAATLPGFDGTFSDRTTNPTTTPTISLSNSLSHADQAGPPHPAAEVTGERTEPRTVRDVVAGMRDRYGFTIVGLDRLGTEAPDCPPNRVPPAAVLQRLLRNYGYIAELTSGSDQNDGAVPQRLIIVGSSILRTGDEAIAVPALPMPELARSPGATRTAGASSVTKTLVHLGFANQPDGAAQPAGKVGMGRSTAMPNPASDASPVTSDLAALTRSAQASLADLVTGLQAACGKAPRC